jgi:hypothetical protein
LKACGVVTGAAAKRNPFVVKISLPEVRIITQYAELMARPPGGFAVLPAQLLHQMLELGRQGWRLGAEIPLQPFADGVADRSAGIAIDLWAIHDSFRFAFIFNVMTQK